MTGTVVAPELELEDIRVVTNDVWSSFLATYGPLEWAEAPLDAAELVQASVAIHGDWSGTVTLEMTPETAETAARTMLFLDAVAPEDVIDALGELVNMIGGNIKSLLPSGSALGLPMVIQTPVRATTGDVTEHYRVELTWAGTPIRIRVWSDENNNQGNATP
jgi:chemotaxis protein CheX